MCVGERVSKEVGEWVCVWAYDIPSEIFKQHFASPLYRSFPIYANIHNNLWNLYAWKRFLSISPFPKISPWKIYKAIKFMFKSFLDKDEKDKKKMHQTTKIGKTCTFD